MNYTVDNKSVLMSEDNIIYVTLNLEPVSTDRTDVIGFSITNSQNDEVLRVEPTNSSVTIALRPGKVNFTVTTIYDCPSQIDTSHYKVDVPSK